MTDPKWIEEALKYLGQHEKYGKGEHNEQIVKFWEMGKVDLDVSDDETPWCAAFVSAMLEEAGVKSARTGWARGYLKWGQKLGMPTNGAVVVFSRGPTAGHVGFVVGRDADGNIMVLGGNQGDEVSIKAFSRDRILGYRWPSEEPLPDIKLAIMDRKGKLSSNEA